ncbi:MAG: LytTR family DNA-binding domain-containing protein [Woeseiaceae bacterium]|nr:LytTR family DNA-binding domain-containing protein [Woeseiaceae bacterium]
MRLAGTNASIEGTSLSGNTATKSSLRKVWEVAAWIALVAVLWGTDLLAKLSERDQFGVGKDTFRLVSEQVTSALAVLVMVLFLVEWLKLFPLSLKNWPRTVIGHTIGTVLFAFGHYSLMVALRAAWYALSDHPYIWRQPFVSNLVVEYQKDIKIYIGFVVVIAAYRYYQRSREPLAQSAVNRLVVQTGSGDKVMRIEQIEYLEAAKNYVAVHSSGREYILRETMANMARKLPADSFVRIHRSFIVNVDQISEIKAADSGHRVILLNGQELPLSRNYREAVARIIGA